MHLAHGTRQVFTEVRGTTLIFIAALVLIVVLAWLCFEFMPDSRYVL